MVDFVVDKGLDRLLAQIDEAAPNRSKASDGSIGDEAHQGTSSKHNPEDTEDSQDGNDPDNQVDARDFTHDPANNADMHIVSESIRQSRDVRVYLVIFDGRQFSSYSKDGYPPFTWRPYYGENKHRQHMHVEVNDYHNDDTSPWKIGIDMGLLPEEYSEIVKGKLTDDNALFYWLRALALGKVPAVVNGKFDWDQMVDADFAGLEQVGDALVQLGDMVTGLHAKLDELAAKVDGISTGGVDVALIADTTADEIAQRLAD